ncbi:MAG: hypothetical protein OXE43_08725 [Chloroflexi bacterium]|nr:hypothetical protein [Chloroflexota bacterium]
MTVKITIRNVPEDVRDALALRAARNRQSMQEYLCEELERLASQPSIDEWLEEVRAQKATMTNSVTAADILEALHADRK